MLNIKLVYVLYIPKDDRGHHGRDRMVVGLTTTYAISAYYQ
jgi:hypothetical protein